MMIGEVDIEEIGIVDTEVEEMITVVEGGDTTGITIVVGALPEEDTTTIDATGVAPAAPLETEAAAVRLLVVEEGIAMIEDVIINLIVVILHVMEDAIMTHVGTGSLMCFGFWLPAGAVSEH